MNGCLALSDWWLCAHVRTHGTGDVYAFGSGCHGATCLAVVRSSTHASSRGLFRCSISASLMMRCGTRAIELPARDGA
jgi:hypothetical protein